MRADAARTAMLRGIEQLEWSATPGVSTRIRGATLPADTTPGTHWLCLGTTDLHGRELIGCRVIWIQVGNGPRQ